MLPAIHDNFFVHYAGYPLCILWNHIKIETSSYRVQSTVQKCLLPSLPFPADSVHIYLDTV